MPDARTCPDCGSEVSPRSPEGLCPRCLLDAGMVGDTPADATISLGGPGGVLETIAASLGPVPRVLLRDTDAGPGPPLVKPGREAVADDSTRYRIDGEIARGGMGAVLKGRDPDLGRDVAIKVLREELLGNPDMVRRFVEEAQIGGQLQHPGIVPIYELGAFADRRPFFSMKLVKGKTLTALLGAREGGDLSRFLSIFESIAQTMAYAHARGVIHRDLKPSNVMVGSFGEVQVMDWGLAKVLPRGGASDEATAGKVVEQGTVITTARSGSDSDLSRAGSVLGTPSYMAPEQARGEVEAVDERVDVFALGSILCEILTGAPAFSGRPSGEIQRRAARGDMADAVARLASAGVDAELAGLSRDCLALPEPADRPPRRRRRGGPRRGLPGRRAGAAAESRAGAGGGAGPSAADHRRRGGRGPADGRRRRGGFAWVQAHEAERTARRSPARWMTPWAAPPASGARREAGEAAHDGPRPRPRRARPRAAARARPTPPPPPRRRAGGRPAPRSGRGRAAGRPGRSRSHPLRRPGGRPVRPRRAQ